MNWPMRSPNDLMESDCLRSASSASLAALATTASRAAFCSTATIFSYDRVIASMAAGSLAYRCRSWSRWAISLSTPLLP